MKTLKIIALILLTAICGCSTENVNPTHKIKVWNDAGLEFIVLLDNPVECQSVILFQGSGVYNSTFEIPDWSNVNLIAQLIKGNCDTIYVQLDKQKHIDQLTTIIKLK